MADITSANAVYALSIPLLFPAAVQLQGFSTDDIFDTEVATVAQTMKGVDGRMSAGFVPYITPQGIFLQADSPSILIFETWNQTAKATLSAIFASAIITLPSIRRKYALTNGILRLYPAIADAKKVLQPRKFTIDWDDVSPASF